MFSHALLSSLLPSPSNVWLTWRILCLACSTLENTRELSSAVCTRLEPFVGQAFHSAVACNSYFEYGTKLQIANQTTALADLNDCGIRKCHCSSAVLSTPLSPARPPNMSHQLPSPTPPSNPPTVLQYSLLLFEGGYLVQSALSLC